MNAPHFNLGNLPMENGSVGYMKAVLAEEQRCCKDIDIRIREVETEYLSMSDNLNVFAKTIDSYGFFARWGIYRKMKALARRMSWHRDVLAKLYDARWRRTYG